MWQRYRFALVARANHRFCAFFEIPSSSDCSDAATEPQGYSAPTPIPRRKLIPAAELATRSLFRDVWTHRQAQSMASIPLALWWAPADAAESPENKATIPVAAI